MIQCLIEDCGNNKGGECSVSSKMVKRSLGEHLVPKNYCESAVIQGKETSVEIDDKVTVVLTYTMGYEYDE